MNPEPLNRGARLRIARTCSYFAVRKATRILADAYDEALRPHGLRGTQFSLLVAITLVEEPTVGALADVLAADRTTMPRTLAPLERDGLIASERGTDRRQRRLRLTPAGERKLAAAAVSWQEAQERVEGALGDRWHDLMAGARAVHALATNADAGAGTVTNAESVADGGGVA